MSSIGNPPYVRMELIKPVKPYLEKHYVVADDRTDLYAYFFERGVGVLKAGRPARLHLILDFFPHRLRREFAQIPRRQCRRSRR